jgi:hypothetical protein
MPPGIVADDAIRPIHEQLDVIGHQSKIDLFLYTRGGVPTSAYRLVKLLNEYCDTLSILVPFRAHSAGTLICLGADHIVMAKLGELSPVDPTTTSPHNPVDRQGRPMAISVEDVREFLEFARRGQIFPSLRRIDTLKLLTGQTPPLALGNVSRVWREGRSIARELLSYHVRGIRSESRINRILKVLTEEYTHAQYITRDKAEAIGLPVETPDDQLESLMTRLLDSYETQLRLREPFDAETVLGQNSTVDFHVWYGMIESTAKSYVAVGAGNVSRPTVQAQQFTLPGFPGPVTLVPHPSSLPVSVKFKESRWRDLSQAYPNV